MNIYLVLQLVGGLALFLFGMEVMGASLRKLSGGSLERVLEKVTASPLKGVLLGAAVTAVIQSSSATTVMVVGFVNSGIMNLAQSIGVIMGANIGTTVTSWILSLSGIQGDAFFVQILKPTTFSPILAIIGVVMMMFSKRNRTQDVGHIMIGFAVLMFGMSTMSGAVAPLADDPEFTNLLLMFSNPLLGVLAGALLTAVIQSSSASVGILQALSLTGAITYGAAIPIIIGQNIGTCVTALLSCIGANKNARRAAMVHLYFNIIGAVIFLTLFYVANAIFKFAFVDTALNAASIAVVHTAFNLLSTAVLLPFSKQLGRLATLTIRDRQDKETHTILDDRYLEMPALAIERCKAATLEMTHLTRDNLMRSMAIVENYDEKLAREIRACEEKIDSYEDAIGTYMVKLTGAEMTVHDSHESAKLLHAIGDLERIGDHASNLVEVAEELHNKRITLSDSARQDVAVMSAAVVEIVTITMDAFEREDLALAARVEPLEQVVDDLKAELRGRHIARLQGGSCTIELGFIFADLITNFERVSDHCSNIAVSLIEINKNLFDTHEYLNHMKADDAQRFNDEYEQYKAKYALD